MKHLLESNNMLVKRFINGLLEENCYILIQNEYALIIDPGSNFDEIKKIIGDRTVLAVLITHYHFDHIGALEDVKKYYDIKEINFKSQKKQKIGPFEFDIIKTPGHKNDSVTYYFKNDNIMFTGDFLFKNSIGRCDMEEGNIFKMMESIKNIRKYNGNIVIYPGHGEEITLEDEFKYNPYLKGELYE